MSSEHDRTVMVDGAGMGRRPRPRAFWVAASLAVSIAVSVTASLDAAPASASIQHHAIQARLDPDQRRIEIVDVVLLGEVPDGPLHWLLHRDLRVSSVTWVVGAAEAELGFERAERFNPRHFWERPDYEQMDHYAVASEVTVQPPDVGWSAIGRIRIEYAGAVFDTLHPPEVAYGRGFETTSGIISDRGAYLAGSSFWLPWSGEEMIRYTLEADVPAGWDVVSQGRREEREVPPDRAGIAWIVEHPMTEAYLIAGPYLRRQQPHRNVVASSYTYLDTPEELTQTYLDATGRYLDMYEDMLGPYPFSKFALVENWWQTGYGMPSFTLLGDRVIRLPFIVDTSYGHEILHNWWGNGVFVDYEAGNWCEGLTTYLADYMYKEQQSEGAARDYRLNQLRGYLDYASEGGRDFPLREFQERDSASTAAVGYGKTMMVFHMLRRRMGDQAFFDALRGFYAEHLFERASWDDVVASAVTIGGVELQPWMEQWIGQAGAPTLTLTDVQARGDGYYVEVFQTEPVYDLNVPLRFGDAEGNENVIGLPMASTTAGITLPAGARWVAVDPGFDLFRKLHRAEIPPSLSQGLGADSTVVVIGKYAEGELRDELLALGERWSENQDMVVVDEADFDGRGGRSVFLFGGGEWVTETLAWGDAFGTQPRDLLASSRQSGHSLIMSFREPANDERAWIVLLPGDATAVSALGRKLPHYGSYSYLVFDGENNVNKGSWEVQTSPLRRPLSAEGDAP